jgi:hypothetical protein
MIEYVALPTVLLHPPRNPMCNNLKPIQAVCAMALVVTRKCACYGNQSSPDIHKRVCQSPTEIDHPTFKKNKFMKKKRRIDKCLVPSSWSLDGKLAFSMLLKEET